MYLTQLTQCAVILKYFDKFLDNFEEIGENVRDRIVAVPEVKN